MKSIREIGNLSLNRINLLGMLQRAFNSRQKKKKNTKKNPSPLTALSLSKSSALALREERAAERQRGRGGRLKAHLLFTLYLHEIVYHLFMLFALFFPSLSPTAPFFSLSDFRFFCLCFFFFFHRHRWRLPRQTLRTITSNRCVL